MTLRYLLIIVLTLVSLQIAPVSATVITAEFPQHYRNTGGPSRFSSGYDTLFIGIDVSPTPKTDPVVGDSTAVTASQNGTVLSLQQPTSVFNPNLYFTTTAYDPGLTGSWNLQVNNSHPSITNSPVNINSQVVGNAQPTDFVQNMALSGSLTDRFTISWTPPPYSDRTQIDITTFADNTSTIIHSAFLPAGTSSYVIPEILLSGLSLIEGETYQITVINNENRPDGSILSAASSFFEFTPTAESINAFLPTVDQSGVYNFNVTVNNANQFIAIDPEVAVGYDYAIGAGNPNFAATILPFVGDDLFELWLFDSLGIPFLFNDMVSAGEVIDFETLVGSEGVSMFRVLGIETDIMLDPLDTTAFVTDVSFVAAGQFTGTMTPITEFVSSVPEPPIIAMISLGLAGLGYRRHCI